MWFKRHADISEYKTLWCTAFSHIPDQLTPKPNDKAERIIFVGYDNRCKRYRLYNPNTDQVVTRRDVIFDDNRLGLHLANVETCVNERLSDSSDYWFFTPDSSPSGEGRHS